MCILEMAEIIVIEIQEETIEKYILGKGRRKCKRNTRKRRKNKEINTQKKVEQRKRRRKNDK